MTSKTIHRPDLSAQNSKSDDASDTADQAASMEVIRDLLFGNQQKSNDARLTALSCELDRLERLVLEKADKAESDLRSLEKKLLQAKQTDFSDLGDAIVGIGQSIKRLGVTQ